MRVSRRLSLLLLAALSAVSGHATPARLTTGEIRLELAISAKARSTPTRFFDNAYVFPDHTWLTEVYLPYFRGLVDQWKGKRPGRPSPELLASLFKSQLGVSNAQGGRASEGEVACAILRSEAGAAGILVRTERGWFRFDPLADQMEPWATVAESGEIRAIEF